jgi:hypothetical protein
LASPGRAGDRRDLLLLLLLEGNVLKLPKLWRKRRRPGGPFVGSYYVKLDGEDVNLGTSDANEARARLLEAVKKRKRNFPDELDEAAAAMEADELPAAAADAAAQGGAVPGQMPAGGSTPPPAPPPPAPPAAAPQVDAAAEAAATNEAAAELGGPSNDNAAPPPMDPDVLRGLVEQAAHVLVDAQLSLQAYIVKRSIGEAPPPMPIEVRNAAGELVLNPATGKPLESPRAIAARAWAVQFEKWFPNLNLPEWAIALILTGAYLPAQFASAAALAESKKQAPTAQPPEKQAVAAS